MTQDDEYDGWSAENEDDDYDDEEEQQEHHKDIEANVYDQGRYYSQRVTDGADYEERERRLNGMMKDTNEIIAARTAENEEVGDMYGQLDSHEDRIRVLQANNDAYRLERLHAAEEAEGRPSSAWNEETGEWGEIQEADYEAEEGPPQGDEDSDGVVDMDLESDSDGE